MSARRGCEDGRVLSRGGLSRVVRWRRSDPDGAGAVRAHVAGQVRGARHGTSRLSVGRPCPRRPALLRPTILLYPRSRRGAGEPATVSPRTQNLPVCQLPMCARCVTTQKCQEGYSVDRLALPWGKAYTPTRWVARVSRVSVTWNIMWIIPASSLSHTLIHPGNLVQTCFNYFADRQTHPQTDSIA